MMGHDGVLEAHLAQRHLLIRIRHLLQIVVTGHERIEKPLGRTGLEQVQDHLGVFGIVLIPRVEQGVARARDRQRRHLTQLKAGLPQHVHDGSVVVAGRFEGNRAGPFQPVQIRD